MAHPKTVNIAIRGIPYQGHELDYEWDTTNQAFDTLLDLVKNHESYEWNVAEQRNEHDEDFAEVEYEVRRKP